MAALSFGWVLLSVAGQASTIGEAIGFAGVGLFVVGCSLYLLALLHIER